MECLARERHRDKTDSRFVFALLMGPARNAREIAIVVERRRRRAVMLAV